MTRISGATAGRIEVPSVTRLAARAAAVVERIARKLAAAMSGLVETRQCQIDRQVARHLAQSGGRLTDDIERRIMRDMQQSGIGMYRE